MLVEVDAEARTVRHLPCGIDIMVMRGIGPAPFPEIGQVLTANSTGDGLLHEAAHFKTGEGILRKKQV